VFDAPARDALAETKAAPAGLGAAAFFCTIRTLFTSRPVVAILDTIIVLTVGGAFLNFLYACITVALWLVEKITAKGILLGVGVLMFLASKGITGLHSIREIYPSFRIQW
jgi:hypothetical protein